MEPIRILNINMGIEAEIDDYSSMLITRSWHGIGSIELHINKHKKHADKLIKNNLIMVGINKVFIIKHREIQLDVGGKATENWLIKGYALKSILSQRVTIPPLNSAYDNVNGSYEAIMKHYVNNNIVNSVDASRNINQLIIANDQQRGINTSYSSRFKNVADEISSLSLMSGLGWNVSLDLVNKKWVFDVVESRDLTTNQNVNHPVIFSPQFESLKSLQYTQSELNYRNQAYVAGQGEGVERRVIEIGDFSGVNRYEIFIDARDVSEVDDDKNPIPEPQIIQTLTERGQQKLSEFLQEEYLEGQILTNSPFKYEIDYDLGDIVTIQNKEWNITMDARITEIKEVYEVDGFNIEATFGNSRPTLIQKIKQEISQFSNEVRR